MFCSLFDPQHLVGGEHRERLKKKNRIFSFNFLITHSVPILILGLVWADVQHKTRALCRRPHTNEGNKQDTTRGGV